MYALLARELGYRIKLCFIRGFRHEADGSNESQSELLELVLQLTLLAPGQANAGECQILRKCSCGRKQAAGQGLKVRRRKQKTTRCHIQLETSKTPTRAGHPANPKN